MNSRSQRAGVASRVVLLVVCACLAIPLLLISLALLSWQASRRQAEVALEAARAEKARQAAIANLNAQPAADAVAPTSVHRASGQSQPNPFPSSDLRPSALRPVRETQYRTESFEAYIPETNPETGQVEYKRSVQQRFVPEPVRRYAPGRQAFGHDSAVMRLADELRKTKDEDENYDHKLGQLRRGLDQEFSQMHEAQSREIAATEKRLNLLKKLHEQRGENQDKIVQRRIDELLGRADALSWQIPDPQPITTATPFRQPNGAWVPAPSTMTAPSTMPPYPAQGGPSTSSAPPLATPVAPPDFASGTPQPGTIQAVPGQPGSPTSYIPGALPADSSEEQTLPRQPQLDTTTDPTATFPQPQGVYGSENPLSAAVNSNVAVIGQVFELARKSGAAKSALQLADSEIERLREMQKKNAITVTELRKAESNLAQIRREVELTDLEIEALRASLKRNQRFAADQLASTISALNAEQARFRQGVSSSTEVIQAEQNANLARERLESINATLAQIDRAMDLLRSSEQQDDQQEGSVPSEQESEARLSVDHADSNDTSERQAVPLIQDDTLLAPSSRLPEETPREDEPANHSEPEASVEPEADSDREGEVAPTVKEDPSE